MFTSGAIMHIYMYSYMLNEDLYRDPNPAFQPIAEARVPVYVCTWFFCLFFLRYQSY